MFACARPSLLRAVGTAPALRGTAPVFRRFVSTERITELEELKILNTQRQNRPNSPHLDIYKPQVTWIMSGGHRITGVALAGVLYAGSLLYCLHPIYPDIDSAHLLASYGSLPAAVKTAIKGAIAFPLTYHSFNGVRHLVWDLGKGLTMKGVYASGYAVLAASAISTIYLTFFV